MDTMAERITQKRKELGLNQAQLARKIGCSRQTVSQWENGHIKDVTGQHLQALARELRVEPAWILTGRSVQCRSTSIEFDQADAQLCERIHNLTEAERAEIAAHLDELDRKQRDLYEMLKARFGGGQRE